MTAVLDDYLTTVCEAVREVEVNLRTGELDRQTLHDIAHDHDVDVMDLVDEMVARGIELSEDY